MQNIPDFLSPFLDVPEMQRLKDVGMNCGCEYTSFPLFKNLKKYSRYEHSLGVALIVWQFTEDMPQTLSALFHDISTPAFAHSVDFLHGDYLNQEYTEQKTEATIKGSCEICAQLEKLNISADDVKDYHRYPIADNDSPRLSADRLEYTLGNSYRYGIRSRDDLTRYFRDITVACTEDGMPELCFNTPELAAGFTEAALDCSKIYVSDEDRYAMQILSEILKVGIELEALSEDDLYSVESSVINKLLSNGETETLWLDFRKMHEMVPVEDLTTRGSRIILAKKRYITPYVVGHGRVTEIYPEIQKKITAFLTADQNYPICAI